MDEIAKTDVPTHVQHKMWNQKSNKSKHHQQHKWRCNYWYNVCVNKWITPGKVMDIKLRMHLTYHMCPMSNGFAPINLAMLVSCYCLNWHNEDQSAQQNCLNTGQFLDIFKLSRIHVRCQSKCNTIDQESSVSCEINTYRHLKNSSLTKFACGYNASHMWALHKR